MRVYFSTVVRAAPLRRGGELVCLDWERKRVLARVPMFASDPDPVDPNERGGARGGRGIALVDGVVVAADYHTLRVFDRELRPVRGLSNGLLLDVHEIDQDGDGTIWVASTGLDAAVQVDLRDGRPRRVVWPREMEPFRERFGLTPLDIDKGADQRVNRELMARDPYRDPSHLHLNTVRRWRGHTYAIFHHQGALVDLDAGRVVVREDDLKGAHNLVVDGDGTALVNDTRRHAVLRYDLESGRRLGRIDLLAMPRLRRLSGRHWTSVAYHGSHVLLRLRQRTGIHIPHKRFPAAPLFVRGLDVVGERIFVGLSPAAIACLDRRSGRLLDLYRHTGDLRVAVHGLQVERPGG